MIVALTLSIATFLSGYSLHAAADSYFQTGECQANEVCLYAYNVDQQFSRNASKNLSFSANVEITCQSVGEFSNTSATQYCMTIINAEVDGEIFNKTLDAENTKWKQDEYVNELLSGWFCFVQTDDGKIVSVQHARDEEESAIDVKKSITAAFQANFKGTEEEIESDPQSDHTSHYKYTSSSNTNVKKMHRHIESDDVLSYSSGANKRNVRLLKDEDIEYRDGSLYHSSGTTEIKLSNKNNGYINEETAEHSISEAFVAQGSYNLDLQQCTTIDEHVQTRHRRSMAEEMNRGLTEESLKVQRDQEQQIKQKISFIRESIPIIPKALDLLLHKDSENVKLFDLLGQLLELEYQYRTRFERHQAHSEFSALQDLLRYLEMIKYSKLIKDVKMRRTIYALLSIEGSLQSQMALLEALQLDIVSGTEKEAIITEISMISNPNLKFVTDLQDYLETLVDQEEKDALLLSFGALASRAQHDAEILISNFVLEQLQSSTDTNDTSSIVHLLLALGNTGSKHVTATILDYLDYETKDVQEAAIIALVKFTYIREVQDALQEVLVSDPVDEEIIHIVLRTLIKGELYAEEMDIDLDAELSHPIYSTLLTIAINTNDTDLINQISVFIRNMGGEKATELLSQLRIRHKRGMDWDAYNSDYDCVASQSSRASDVATYSKHKAYIYGKTLGNSDVHMKVGAGVFVGMSSDCNNMKGFARACARAKFFFSSRDLAEIELKVVKTGANINGKAYVQYGGITRLNYQRSVNAAYCFAYDRLLYASQQRLFQYTYSFFVYVGTVDATISLYLSLNVNFEAQMCATADITQRSSATAAIIPKVTLTLEGSASFTFIGIARVGLSAEATIAYQIEPKGTAQGCISCTSIQYQTCANLYDSWPGNTISLYAWYQTRQVRSCYTGGWIKIKYPCISWSSKKRWDSLSWTWSLGSSSRKVISSYCYPLSSNFGSCPTIAKLPTPPEPKWPSGMYSLIQGANGCPTGMSSGWIYQDNEDDNNINSWSPSSIASFVKIDVGRNFKTYYCTKTSASGTSSWPSGSYCIAKYGSSCPNSFSSGSIYWDDEDSSNANSYSNPIPSGSYGGNTRINFCCRNDGYYNNPISLPSTQAFALYRYGGQCQKVNGMNQPKELIIRFDDEDSANANSCSGFRPDGPCGSNHVLTICYYSPM